MKYKITIITETIVLEQEISFEDLYQYLEYLKTIPNIVDIKVSRIDTFKLKKY